jgi:hypothetical protein
MACSAGDEPKGSGLLGLVTPRSVTPIADTWRGLERARRLPDDPSPAQRPSPAEAGHLIALALVQQALRVCLNYFEPKPQRRACNAGSGC